MYTSFRILLFINLIFHFVAKNGICSSIRSTLLTYENKNQSNITSRIISGEKANIKDFPFFAFLGNCGGAIISDRWIVTAAHCVINEDISKITVSVGSEGEEGSQKYYPSKIVHYIYNPLNDIALIKLSKKLKFSSKVRPVNLPTGNFKHGLMVLVARGFDESMNMSERMMKTELYAFREGWNCGVIGPKSVFCTHREGFAAGPCYGDSGSPLVNGNELVGILIGLTNADCSNNRFTVFLNVREFVPWILETMENN